MGTSRPSIAPCSWGRLRAVNQVLAVAVDDYYSVASGAGVYAGMANPGIPAAGVSPLAAFIGDSLTAQDFGVTPIYWQLGLQGGRLQPVANSGFPGRSTQGLSTGIGNSYLIDTEPGFGGLAALYGRLGWIFMRIGANDYRGADGSAGTAINSVNQGYIDSIVTQLLALTEHLVIFACSPLSDALLTRKTNIATWSAYMQTKAAADPTRVHYINDCATMVDGAGDLVPAYYQADRVHFSSAGTYEMGQAAQAQLTALFANQSYANPLITDPTRVYPAFDQWNPNPTNTGTGGTFGAGWSGVCPTGMRIEGNGAGTGGTVAIEAAAGGDSNSTPWVVLTPTSLQAGSSISISFPGSGRTIDGSTPSTLEQMVEFRAASLANFSGIDSWIQAVSGLKLTKVLHFVWNAATVLSRTWTGRQKLYRTSPTASGASTTNFIYAGGVTASGAMGSLAFRCFSVEG